MFLDTVDEVMGPSRHCSTSLIQKGGPMAEGNRGRWGVASLGTVLLAGLLAGSVLLTPVGAHITSFNHLKASHFYTKKAADTRFVNVGEKVLSAATADTAAKAATATNADTAKNADTLDGVDSTAFAQTSSVLFAVVSSAGALVHGRGVTSTTRLGAGEYRVFFNRDVSNCATGASIGGYATGPDTNTGFVIGTAQATVRGTGPGFNNEVAVATLNVDSASADRGFHLVVVC
jgi:hypothetical protein